MTMTTWRKELDAAFQITGDSFVGLSITLSPDELDAEFDDGYGSVKGKPFTAWSERFVYFPAQYDGAEWVSWVSRNPDGRPTEHIGG